MKVTSMSGASNDDNNSPTEENGKHWALFFVVHRKRLIRSFHDLL